MIATLLVDAYPGMRDILRIWLAPEPGLAVAGEAADGAETLRLAAALRPQVVVLVIYQEEDAEDVGKSGLEVCRELTVRHPDVAVLVFSRHDWDIALAGAWSAGAAGFLHKSARREEVVRAVRQAAQGGCGCSRRSSSGGSGIGSRGQGGW